MAESGGLVFAFAIEGKGKARELNWEEFKSWSATDGLLWAHLDYAHPVTRAWLYEESDIDPVVREALVAHDPRPRCTRVYDGLLLVFRGVNLNEGSDPEDMVSLRVWADENRVFTFRHRPFNAVSRLRKEIQKGDLPTTSGDLLVSLLDHTYEKVAVVVDKLDGDIDDIEDQVLCAEDHNLRHRIAHFRRAAIALRRHIAPQREALARLQAERVSWLADPDRVLLRETSERLARIIDELDSAKERAVVTSEELTNQLSEIMNRRLYGLSIIAAIFLPLGFLTGLMGVNLAGIPGTRWAGSFAVMCVTMVGLGFGQVWFFRKKGWF